MADKIFAIEKGVFIDRENDLKFLLDIFTSVHNELKGQTVFVLGEPGIGKSALVEEFLSRASENFDITILRGRGYEEQSSPLFPSVEMIGQLLSQPAYRYYKLIIESSFQRPPA